MSQRPQIRQAHAIGREHAREGMDKYPLQAEGVCDLAGMLATGAAEADQREFSDIVSSLHRDLFNGVGHTFNRYSQEAACQFLCADGPACCVGDRVC